MNQIISIYCSHLGLERAAVSIMLFFPVLLLPDWSSLCPSSHPLTFSKESSWPCNLTPRHSNTGWGSCADLGKTAVLFFPFPFHIAGHRAQGHVHAELSPSKLLLQAHYNQSWSHLLAHSLSSQNLTLSPVVLVSHVPYPLPYIHMSNFSLSLKTRCLSD